MSLETIIKERSNSVCELCGSRESTNIFQVSHAPDESSDSNIMVCTNCQSQIEDPEKVVPTHWRCLNDAMWSEVPGVQVIAWRMLNQLRGEGWPSDLLEMLYLSEEIQVWAKAGFKDQDEIVKHVDSNGTTLQSGDKILLIKDLNVKGAGFTAKRGTLVKNISLVEDNPNHIEGKINGQHIVILTQFVKKSV